MAATNPSPATPRRALAILLAAGEGTRMKSARPKVLHEIAGRSMLGHALTAMRGAGAEHVALVIGPGHDAVAAEAKRWAPDVEIFIQHERRGTAHATLAARDAIARGFDDVLVSYADVPLVSAATLQRMRAELVGGAGVVVLGYEPPEPVNGRLLERDGELIAIREAKDATPVELAIRRCNAGPMAFSGDAALRRLSSIKTENAQKEYYLTDMVEVTRAEGLKGRVVVAEADEALGVNDRSQLAQAEAALQKRLRAAAMREGATLRAPETVFLSYDTKLGRDVVIEPHVVFGPGVEVADGVAIQAFSHLEGAKVGAGVSLGPFARLRKGADLGENVHVGNFVEVKAARLDPGVKAGHLSYLGDAHIGANTNIGAGTITCNYDGFAKHRTEIGADAFIGSNSALVAPVSVGDGAFVGSGSVITEPVPKDALALGRGRQVVKEGRAKSYRAEKAAKKK